MSDTMQEVRAGMFALPGGLHYGDRVVAVDRLCCHASVLVLALAPIPSPER